MSDGLMAVEQKGGLQTYIFAKWMILADKPLLDEKYDEIWQRPDKERVKFLARDDAERDEIQELLRAEGILFDQEVNVELTTDEKEIVRRNGITDRSQVEQVLATQVELSTELDNATTLTEIKEVLKKRLAGGSRTGVSRIV